VIKCTRAFLEAESTQKFLRFNDNGVVSCACLDGVNTTKRRETVVGGAACLNAVELRDAPHATFINLHGEAAEKPGSVDVCVCER